MSRDCPDHGWECTGLGHERKVNMNEIGSVTKAVEADKDKDKKIRVTIIKEYTPDKSNYKFTYNEDDEPVTHTDEELDALTAQEMMDIDKSAFEDGEFGLDDLLDFEGTGIKEVKWEVVDAD